MPHQMEFPPSPEELAKENKNLKAALRTCLQLLNDYTTKLDELNDEMTKVIWGRDNGDWPSDVSALSGFKELACEHEEWSTSNLDGVERCKSCFKKRKPTRGMRPI